VCDDLGGGVEGAHGHGHADGETEVAGQKCGGRSIGNSQLYINTLCKI
jgi:hypothetical protein